MCQKNTFVGPRWGAYREARGRKGKERGGMGKGAVERERRGRETGKRTERVIPILLFTERSHVSHYAGGYIVTLLVYFFHNSSGSL